MRIAFWIFNVAGWLTILISTDIDLFSWAGLGSVVGGTLLVASGYIDALNDAGKPGPRIGGIRL
jgi:hypothetical protein